MTETTTTRIVHPVVGQPSTWVRCSADKVTLRLADLDSEVTILPGGAVDVRTMANAAVAFARAWHVNAEDIAYCGGDAEYARSVSLNSLLGRCSDGCCGVGADIPEPTLDPAQDDEWAEWTDRARALHHVARCVRTARWGV